MREYENPLFSEHTSIRLGGRAIAKIILENDEDFEKLPERLKFWGGAPLWLGRGTNLLADDRDLPIVIVKFSGNAIEIAGAENGKILVRAEAGATVAQLLGFCVKNGLSGLEGMTGIPGSVGGAAAMNAGSFGDDVASCLYAATVWHSGQKTLLKADALQGEYRKMNFGNIKDAFITEVIFALTTLPINVIFKRMRHNFFKKKSGQPLQDWSAGCAFKNPPGISAGKLLEEAGLKGKKLGGMAFSSRHANFLINTGKGTASAAFELLGLASEKVLAESGHKLDLEIRVAQ